MHTEMTITQPGVIQYTVFVERSCHYLCDVKIVTIDIEVEVKTVSFSKLMWLLYYHNNV